MEQLSFDLDDKKPFRPTPLSVRELNLYVKDLVDRDDFLNNVYVKGEISNFKRHYTGHLYFTLKDKDSLIKCVMFKSYTSNIKFEPQDGMQVVILGQVAVYERDGVYQIYVKGMEQEGLGALYEAYEKLKAKLEAQGLFDESHKKEIPLLPKAIGVVTSKTGAVIKDIINVTTRRFPNVVIKLYPSAVQGVGAAETIVEGIKYFNKAKNVDTIIIARGGGSLEDLWPFNEEITAHAIYESEIPIISAVGHETDFTIADFVADLRAPTPSAAGELAVPDLEELKWKIQNINHRLSLSLNKKIENMKARYEKAMRSKVMMDPLSMLNERRLKQDYLIKQLANSIKLELKNKKIELVKIVSSLDGLSPLKTLTRGYAFVEKEDGTIIKSAKDLVKNDEIKITLADGNVEAKVL
ncbi:MAG: exodeoxyribonuclease VII large subunit [Clostridia bacterium]|nr:exodeoxyribonuclease VII large subunit [Clostridia bacterium]